MNTKRLKLYKQIEKLRDSKLIVFVTGDRRQLETQISKEVIDLFVHHLDLINHHKRITLYLYTNGGDVIACWSIANLIRQFCDDFEVLVSSKALSGGTLICLGASNIIMTKQACLGPIDPSMNSPLNPLIPGAPPHARSPVSVEAVQGFLDFAKATIGPKTNLKDIFLHLAGTIHPHVLGQAYRTRGQIRMLAQKLLSRHLGDAKRMKTILDFLCGESGSHDYTITRQEARDSLKLPIERPDEKLYNVIKAVHEDIADDLDLRRPYDPNVLVSASTPTATYAFRRALLESVKGGTHYFTSEGTLSGQSIQVQPGVTQQTISDNRTFEGWKHTP